MSEHEHTEPEPDERVEDIDDLDAPDRQPDDGAEAAAAHEDEIELKR